MEKKELVNLVPKVVKNSDKEILDKQNESKFSSKSDAKDKPNIPDEGVTTNTIHFVGNHINNYTVTNAFFNNRKYPGLKWQKNDFAENVIDVEIPELKNGKIEVKNEKFDISYMRRSYAEYTASQNLGDKIIALNNLTNITNYLAWIPNLHDLVVEQSYAVQHVQDPDVQIDTQYPHAGNLTPIDQWQANIKSLEQQLARPTLTAQTIAKYYAAQRGNPYNRELLLDNPNVLLWYFGFRIGCEKTNRCWQTEDTVTYNMINTNLSITDNQFKMSRLQNDNYGNNNRLLIRGMIYNGQNNSPKKYNPSVFVIKACKILDDVSVGFNSYAGFNSHNLFSLLPDRTGAQYVNQTNPHWIEEPAVCAAWTDLNHFRSMMSGDNASFDGWYVFPIKMAFIRETQYLAALIMLIAPSWLTGCSQDLLRASQYGQNDGNNTFDSVNLQLKTTKTANRCIIDGPQNILFLVYDYDVVPDDEAEDATLVQGGEPIPYVDDDAKLVEHNLIEDIRHLYVGYNFSSMHDLLHKTLNMIGLDFFETDFKLYTLMTTRIAFFSQKSFSNDMATVPDNLAPPINLLLQPAHFKSKAIDGMFEYPDYKQILGFNLNDLILYSENYIIFSNNIGFINLKFVFQTMYGASIQKTLNNNCLTLSDVINGNSNQFAQRYRIVAMALLNKFGPSTYTAYDFQINYMCQTDQRNLLAFTVQDDRLQYSLRIYVDVIEWLILNFFKNDETKGSQGVDSGNNYLKFTEISNSASNYVSFQANCVLNLNIPELKQIEKEFNYRVYPEYFKDANIGNTNYDVPRSRVAVQLFQAADFEYVTVPLVKVDALNYVNMPADTTIDLHFGFSTSVERLRLGLFPFLKSSKRRPVSLLLTFNDRNINYPNNKIIVKNINTGANINDEEFVQHGDIIEIDLSDV